MRRTGRLAVPLLMSLVLSLMVAVSSFVSPLAPQHVAADNGLTVTKSVDGNPLIGGPTTYTITVRNNSFAAGAQNPDGKAYNLDITDVLPPGVLFTGATGADTSPTITTVQTGMAPNQIPQQTVKFTNLTDLARNQTYTLMLAATLNPNVKTPGTALANNASAAVSNDPRKPASDADGRRFHRQRGGKQHCPPLPADEKGRAVHRRQPGHGRLPDGDELARWCGPRLSL